MKLLPRLDVNLFMSERYTKEMLHGLTWEEKANTIAEYYGLELESFGNETAYDAGKIDFLAVNLGKVRVRLFNSEKEYLEKRMKIAK
ncbi:MAG: hypothetical protein E6356_16990 [Terrisporobacter othiniensis]|nr:hypothetical protein [Terrisporobacter othiniensis]